MSYSEGEEFLKDFFNEKRISYEPQKKIEALEGDYADYRITDFYLPQYDVYVEFLGKWNSGEEEQKKYKKKMAIYYRNKIPCVYIFPDNLGTIEWSFRNCLRQELLKHKKIGGLIHYEFNNFYDKNKWFMIILLGLIIINSGWKSIFVATGVHLLIVIGYIYQTRKQIKNNFNIKKE